jgi:cytochrome c biogenesis protein CcmG/thiol:disulfide interchange protein DsbE
MSDPLVDRRPAWRWGLGWSVVVLLVIGSLVVAGGHSVRRDGIEPLDRPAPAVTLTTFADRQVALADLRGRPVVVNFWASWSDDSRVEAPMIERVWQEYKGGGVVVLGVAVHEQLAEHDPDHNPNAFVKRARLTYPAGHDRDGSIGRGFGLTGVPETYFITPAGSIAGRRVGPLDEATLRRGLDELMARR